MTFRSLHFAANEVVYLGPCSWLAEVLEQKVVEPHSCRPDRAALNVVDGGKGRNPSGNRLLSDLFRVL